MVRMIVVIIAGGSGTRLWPLSTPDYPKHLLSLTNELSLLQNTYNRVEKLTDSSNIFVVSEVSHAQHVHEQLPGIPSENILVEPARKGTASCFLLALQELKRRGIDDQAVFFLWADHVVRDTRGFVATANRAAALAERHQKIVFVGVEPTNAATGFGYMKKGTPAEEAPDRAFELAKFVEKPNKSTAVKYFQSGNYLWNTGYLVTTVPTLEREIQEHSALLWDEYQQLLHSDDVSKTYLSFESQVMEYALSEKIQDAMVVAGVFDWMDIGSFKDLHGIGEQDDHGNYFRGKRVVTEQVTNSYVRNEQPLPVAVIGLDNIAVVATEHGILITNKNYAQRVGDIGKAAEETLKD